MDIIKIKPFKGKNIYSHKPVIRAEVDIGEWYDTPTCSIDRFNERLLQMLPGLRKHYCALGYEGGFLTRLEEGTYLTHVTEHTVIELQNIYGYKVNYGRSRQLDSQTRYYMAFEYENEKFAIECLITAVEMINLLLEGKMPQIQDIRKHLAKTAADTDMGPSTSAVYQEAKRRGIPVASLDNSSVLQLGNGKYTHYMEASLTDKPGCIPVDMAGNKHLTKRILSDAGIPVPAGDIAYTLPSAVAVAAELGFPVVLKPFDANQGKGVFTNICTRAELDEAFATATRYSRAVIVERHIPGRDYRLLIVGGRLSAAAERVPPIVTGDGIHTIRELVDLENENPLRGFDHEKPLTKIKLDDMSKQVLAKSGLEETNIPEAGRKVVLRFNGNISTGGMATDCTDEVHPQNARLAIKAAVLLKLDVAGIDITCRDIAEPVTEGNGAVIEVNAAPGLRMHLFPSEGEARNVAGDILQHLYPEGSCVRVPIIAVTGTNGKTTVTRMIEYTLGLTGKTIGATNTSGIYIDGECVLKGDNTGTASAAMLLRDTRIDAAVLETARGGIIKRGLGYDFADVGVVTNIAGDHLGLDGIHTVEDLAMVKALVVEAVKPDGYAVLNADDAMTPILLDRVASKTMLFSKSCRNPLVLKHSENGNPSVYVKEEALYYNNGSVEKKLLRVRDIPITFNGSAECNIENSLAAAAALLAFGISANTVRAGLKGFQPDIRLNPGRFNVINMGRFRVMLDYGHNPDGYRAVIQMMAGLGASSFTGVIGMPGDRLNESIGEVGSLCAAAFSRLYIKEDNDLRGRNAGEVADLLYHAAISGGVEPSAVTIIYSEALAFEKAILEAKPGELVVLFYEEFETALQVVEKCKEILIHRGKSARRSEDRTSFGSKLRKSVDKSVIETGNAGIGGVDLPETVSGEEDSEESTMDDEGNEDTSAAG